jgi:hypothetical protein
MRNLLVLTAAQASDYEKTRFTFLVFQFLFLKFNLACLPPTATSIWLLVNTVC